jgi:hypothetical protein
MKKLDMKVEKQFVTNMALNFTHALVEKVAGQDGKMKEMVEVEVVAVVAVAVAAAAVAEEVQAAAEELHHHQVEMEAAEVEDQKVEAAHRAAEEVAAQAKEDLVQCLVKRYAESPVWVVKHLMVAAEDVAAEAGAAEVAADNFFICKKRLIQRSQPLFLFYLNINKKRWPYGVNAFAIQ